MDLEVVVFFFSKRVKKVLSIEHDKNYFEKVKFLNKDLNSKINFKLIEPEFDLSEKIFTSQKSKRYKNLSFKKFLNHFCAAFLLVGSHIVCNLPG